MFIYGEGDIEFLKDTTQERIYQSHIDNREERRGRRLGASQVGNECEYSLWLSFRWASKQEDFSGRMLKLFERGQNEEAIFIRDLKRIGIDVDEVDEKTGEQFNIHMLGGHFGGYLDGVGTGFIEAPKKKHVLEFKTHNDKSFKKLKKEGVKKSKPSHYDQCQTYMHGTGLDRAFYFAVNKNDDELYSERIEYDLSYALRLIEKAKRVIFSKFPRGKISERPDFFKCKMCSNKDVCFKEALPERNCRTCAHSTPLDSGGWSCGSTGDLLPVVEQLKGCKEHRFIPPIVGEPVSVDGQNVTYKNGYIDKGYDNEKTNR